tara:strand:+ start:140 stop:346 length:207 start_codon:yes stop_codon:yes gene_type:complete
MLETKSNTIKGIDKLGNIYKRVTTQDYTFGNPKLTIIYFFNGKKVTKYDGWLVQEWFSNNYGYGEISK